MINVASPTVGEEEQLAVSRVLQSGMLAQGPEVKAFEEEFSVVSGTSECVAVNSGTSALHLGLLASGIGVGDEVILPSFSFAATANSVALTGATPIFADIDPDTFCIDPIDVERKITPRTKAVMVVHLYGQAADMPTLMKVAEDSKLQVFEDAAQAHMATSNGQLVGGIGRFGAFSFYPTKNMTSGEGGMISTNDPELARYARLLRNQGMEERYKNEVVGFNARMTDLHASIGRVQLERLAALTELRQNNARDLTKGIEGVVTTPKVLEGSSHVYHQYTIKVPNREEFQQHLFESGVGSGVYYPVPIHRLPSFDVDTNLPNTEAVAKEALSIPVHPNLSKGDIEKIVVAVKDAAAATAH